MKARPKNASTLPSGAERLRAIITKNVESMPNASASDLADWTMAHQRTLIKEFYAAWARKELTFLYRAEIQRQQPMRRGRPRLNHPQQRRLPGFEGIPFKFTSVPGPIGTRKQIKLPDATLADLKARRELIRRKLAAELPDLNRLIALMEPYDRAEPGIKVAEALRRQAAEKGDRQA